MQKTYTPKMKKGEIARGWHLVDVKGRVLGRVATEMVRLLMGKGKVNYTPNLDMGDFVVVVNAKEVELTGKKEEQKLYRRHSRYPGGLKEQTAAELREKYPGRMVELAVAGMLPKNKLRKVRMARLKVFEGERHLYEDKLKKDGK